MGSPSGAGTVAKLSSALGTEPTLVGINFFTQEEAKLKANSLISPEALLSQNLTLKGKSTGDNDSPQLGKSPQGR